MIGSFLSKIKTNCRYVMFVFFAFERVPRVHFFTMIVLYLLIKCLPKRSPINQLQKRTAAEY